MSTLDRPVNDKDNEQVKATGSEPGDCPIKGPESDTRNSETEKSAPSTTMVSELHTKNGETAKSTPPATGNNTEAADKRKRVLEDASVNDQKQTKSAKAISELHTKNGETAKSTPPATGNNTEAADKRKRVLEDASVNDQKQTKSAKAMPVSNTTTESENEHFTSVETTTGVKEVEMVDAETIQGSVEPGIKEVEMQDAEVVDNETRIEEKITKDERPDVRDEEKITKDERPDVRDEGKTHPDINKDEAGPNLSVTEGFKQYQGIKETEKPKEIGATESNDKRINDAAANDGSGQQVLGEVATLLKQVQESDTKAKLEVEVKVKKMDQGDVKENSEVNDCTQTSARVSCP